MIARSTCLLLLACITPALPAQGQDDRPDRSVKDPELQGDINQAIFRGIDYLKKAQKPNGSWTYDRDEGTGGLTALALYALAASGVPPTDPAIERGVRWCTDNKRSFSELCQYGTYSASLLVLALTRIDAKTHKRWIGRLAIKIANAQLPNGQWSYRIEDRKATSASSRDRGRRGRPGRGGFGRRGPGGLESRGDNSNTQFAVLALWAAKAMANAKISRKVWKRIESFFLRTQTKTGEWCYIDQTETVAEPANGPGRGPGGRGRGGRGGGRGGRMERFRRPTLTMTAAGLCSFVYAYSALRGVVRGLAKARKSKSAQTGLKAFLDKQDAWSFQNYYLVYSIERVGTVLGVPEDRWYPQGAKKLIRQQRKDGRWSVGGFGRRGGGMHGDANNVYETALALLFLSKATAYPITGGKKAARRPQK